VLCWAAACTSVHMCSLQPCMLLCLPCHCAQPTPAQSWALLVLVLLPPLPCPAAGCVGGAGGHAAAAGAAGWAVGRSTGGDAGSTTHFARAAATAAAPSKPAFANKHLHCLPHCMPRPVFTLPMGGPCLPASLPFPACRRATLRSGCSGCRLSTASRGRATPRWRAWRRRRGGCCRARRWPGTRTSLLRWVGGPL
jgi:hypothetical protein